MALPPDVVELPLREIPRTLMFDLKGYEVGRRLHRNVLMARTAIRPSTNFISEQTLTLDAVGGTATSHNLEGKPGNRVTVMCASAAVRMVLTTSAGVLDLGLLPFFIITSEILALAITNESADPIDVELIHA